MHRLPPGPHQESVWDYPRPPRLEPSTRRVRVLFAGYSIADSTAAFRVLETSHPPTWYIPPTDIATQLLEPVPARQSICEWKGAARYWSLVIENGQRVQNVGWSYPRPNPAFAAMAGYLAFYPHLVECWVDEERVHPQAGGFYGGWITSEIVGPFKGIPGSSGW